MPEAEFFERLEAQILKELPFVAYRKPILYGNVGTVKAFLLPNDDLLYTQDFTDSGFVFAPFADSEKTILFQENVSEKFSFEQLVTEDILADTRSTKKEIPEEKKPFHIQLVERAVSALKSGEIEKVVLSRREEVDLEEENPLNLFLELLNTYSRAFVYCWFHPKIGCWLGATPETLLKIEGTRFKTMALAGTQKFSGNMDVEWGPKEQQEQGLVTDSILLSLRKSGVINLEVSAPYSAKAGNLLHIRTDIEGKIPDSRFDSSNKHSGTGGNNQAGTGNLREIIMALHPTPAVCGLPKEKAKEFILSEERYDREFYTGFLGELNLQKNVQRSRTRRNVENLAYRAVKKETDLYVNLRCMKIESGKAILYIGGGITVDSVPEDEWEETVNKAETMKKVLLK